MRRVLEIFFAHKVLLVAPLVAALAGTAGVVLLQPATYQSTAIVWVVGGGAGTQSAAQTQADIISQFLKSNTFAASVADQSPLGDYLDTHRGATQGFSVKSFIGGDSDLTKPSPDAVRQYLAAHVAIAALGPSELSVTVTGPTPQVAKGTADALLSQLTAAEIAAKTSTLQAQLALYQSRLQSQATVVKSDLEAVHAYVAANPRATAADPQLALLQAKASVDQQTYADLLTSIQKAQADLALANQILPLRVTDAPQLPSAQSLLGKQQLMAIAAGVIAGFLAVAAMGALLVRLDTTIHTASEIPALLGLQAIGATPLSKGR